MSWRQVTDRLKHSKPTLHLAARLGRGRGRLRWLDHLHKPASAPIKPDMSRWQTDVLAATWLGHATVLLRIAGKTVLTDPVLGMGVGLGLGIVTGGPRRLIAPALTLRELPPIDLVLISHAHFDHLDRPTLNRLSKRTPIVTAHRTRDLIVDLGFKRVKELNWGESTTVGNLRITAQSVAHWGARTFFDNHRGFNGYLLESPHHRVLYGGDTAYHEGFLHVGKVDLAILGIGAYNPYEAAHATPEQAWAMANHLKADYVLPMHHSTFHLGHEPAGEPMRRLLAAAGSEAGRVVVRAIGGQFAAPAIGD